MSIIIGAVRNRWPLAVAMLLLAGLVANAVATMARDAHGTPIYALDDPYIHLAVAGNVVRHGTWGINPDDFSSCTSSILWTLLLSAGCLLTTHYELTPLVLNVVFAAVTLCAAYRVFRHDRFPPLAILTMLIFLTVVTPMPALIASGMEHLLHTALSLIFLHVSVIALERGPLGMERRRALVSCLLLAPCLTMARYEGLFLVFCAALLAVWRRRWGWALAVCVCACLPVGVYGVISRLNGWFWFPTSLLLKAHIPGQSAGAFLKFALTPGVALFRAPHLYSLFFANMALLFFVWKKFGTLWNRAGLTILLFFGSLYWHLQFARVGMFYRYEAYLVVMGIVSSAIGARCVCPSLTQIRANRTPRTPLAIVALLAYALAAPLLHRGGRSYVDIRRASRDIFEQQYQMAQFVRRYYNDARIGVNDIGFVSMLSDARIVDFWGLADREVAGLMLANQYDTAAFARIAGTDMNLAIVYDAGFEQYGGMPGEWIKVGTWRVADDCVLGSDTVTFYSPQPAGQGYLRRCLEEYDARLPPTVARQIFPAR